jgi:hypothetical protein
MESAVDNEEHGQEPYVLFHRKISGENRLYIEGEYGKIRWGSREAEGRDVRREIGQRAPGTGNRADQETDLEHNTSDA